MTTFIQAVSWIVTKLHNSNKSGKYWSPTAGVGETLLKAPGVLLDSRKAALENEVHSGLTERAAVALSQ